MRINRKLLKRRLLNLKMFGRYLARQVLKHHRAEESTILFIVTFPRSGSTALGSFFDSIGSPFYYYGEVFGFNQWPKGIDRITANYPFFSSRYLKRFLQKKKEGTIPYKFETSGMKPAKVLRSIQKTPGIHVFKIMSFHFRPERLENLIEQFHPKVLFLRRNHLDRFISTKKAQTTGKWHGFNTDEDLIEVDEKSLARSIESSINFYDDIRQCCLSNKVDWLDLDYSEVFSQSKLQEILNFTGVQFSQNDLLSLITTKRQDSKHFSRERFLQSSQSPGTNKFLTNYAFNKRGD
ncbi:MAG: sulfotransferase domain-containing protein [Candidatus Nanopelagicaceae bacterium]|nr:sulfotransferase domain-containing protein [Candidatus Nanopelagicaceae bacterium]